MEVAACLPAIHTHTHTHGNRQKTMHLYAAAACLRFHLNIQARSNEFFDATQTFNLHWACLLSDLFHRTDLPRYETKYIQFFRSRGKNFRTLIKLITGTFHVNPNSQMIEINLLLLIIQRIYFLNIFRITIF